MELLTQFDPIVLKTVELCRLILDQPEFQKIQRDVDAFMNNSEAQEQYTRLNEKGEYLQMKQSQGLQISSEEIVEFEKIRETLLKNPVARGFIDAQEGMHKIQESVNRYISKTFELGRVPEAEDLAGGCGSGCGCHH